MIAGPRIPARWVLELEATRERINDIDTRNGGDQAIGRALLIIDALVERAHADLAGAETHAPPIAA